jgi:hypothetical protein
MLKHNLRMEHDLRLAVFLSPYWLLLTAFAGVNLLQSAFTNWCPMVWLLARIWLEPCVPTHQSPRDANPEL